MEKMTSEEIFIAMVNRVNRLLIILGVFFLIYFLLEIKANIYLFLLALLNMGFSLLSYKHMLITNRLIVELQRARVALSDVSKEARKMHDV